MIRTEDLTKIYDDTIAVNELNLHVQKGDAFGFIGPNGAGKTTTISMLAGLVKPTRGRVFIDDTLYLDSTWMPHGAMPVKAKIGYIPDRFGVYENLTVREYLHFFACAYKLPADKRKTAIDDAIALTDLTARSGGLVAALSRGMQQRLALARVLLHNPEVLLLDEPASGLDARARVEVRELLKELRRMGKTIFVASHVLTELEDLCNRIGIVEAGSLMFVGTLDELRAKIATQQVVHVQVAGRGDEAIALIAAQPYVDTVQPTDGAIAVHMKTAMPSESHLAQQLCAAGFALTHYEIDRPTLETVFIKLTKGVLQ